MKWPFKERENSLTEVLHRALRKKYNREFLTDMENMALDVYFPEGYTFMSETEYGRRVARGDFKGVRGGIVSVTDGRVNIHTKVSTKQT